MGFIQHVIGSDEMKRLGQLSAKEEQPVVQGLAAQHVGVYENTVHDNILTACCYLRDGWIRSVLNAVFELQLKQFVECFGTLFLTLVSEGSDVRETEPVVAANPVARNTSVFNHFH